MSYNRIRSFSRIHAGRAALRPAAKAAFVPIPAGVVQGGLQPWQENLYAWAMSAARAATQARLHWLLRRSAENN